MWLSFFYMLSCYHLGDFSFDVSLWIHWTVYVCTCSSVFETVSAPPLLFFGMFVWKAEQWRDRSFCLHSQMAGLVRSKPWIRNSSRSSMWIAGLEVVLQYGGASFANGGLTCSGTVLFPSFLEGPSNFKVQVLEFQYWSVISVAHGFHIFCWEVSNSYFLHGCLDVTSFIFCSVILM